MSGCGSALHPETGIIITVNAAASFSTKHPSEPVRFALPGQEDYDRLRPLSYVEANLILVCFDVTNPTSFDNVMIKWHPEVRHFCRDIPVILIGCKTDLRKDKECTRKLKAMNQSPVTYAQGVEAQRQMNAQLYLECSAKYQENVENVFKEATKTTLAFQRKRRRHKRRKKCVIL
ncbi:rho-related GTP-binding protein RhoF isoform X2 [Synchiropus splendidus]|uniref:rho-related GTP-binding protein RhoF isoform X2 n=1 Tax=Synchiropus splendidus TaxID=270530 RepID=UPI00237EE6F5|nr:rho-related GTP-binding protein RhoF isoform X2 [Synchiropus splendidus]